MFKTTTVKKSVGCFFEGEKIDWYWLIEHANDCDKGQKKLTSTLAQPEVIIRLLHYEMCLAKSARDENLGKQPYVMSMS